MRTVQCTIYFQHSRKIEKLPDDDCEDIKPPTIEMCHLPACSPDSSAASSSSQSHAVYSVDGADASLLDAPASPSFSASSKRHTNVLSRDLMHTNSPSFSSKGTLPSSSSSAKTTDSASLASPGVVDIAATASSGKTIYLQETLERKSLQDEDDDDDENEDDVDEIERKEQQLQQQQPMQQQQQGATNSESKDSQMLFQWRTNGFTPCSHPCLGGKNKSTKTHLPAACCVFVDSLSSPLLSPLPLSHTTTADPSFRLPSSSCLFLSRFPISLSPPPLVPW